MKNIIPFCFLLLLFLVTGCFTHWSDEERAEFEAKCASTKTFDNEGFLFRGFDNAEFDSIVIKEYQGQVLLDSFKMYVSPSVTPYDVEYKCRSGSFDREMNIDYTYHFLIPGYEPYVLADMEMVMWPQYTMMSEGWGCIMGNYTVDGVRFEDNGPEFVKR